MRCSRIKGADGDTVGVNDGVRVLRVCIVFRVICFHDYLQTFPLTCVVYFHRDIVAIV